MGRNALVLDFDQIEYLGTKQRETLRHLLQHYNEMLSHSQFIDYCVSEGWVDKQFAFATPCVLSRDEVLLYAFDKIAQNHGVESINRDEWWVGWYGNSVAMYSNTGDSYMLTLCRNNQLGEFRITDYESLVKWVDETIKECKR